MRHLRSSAFQIPLLTCRVILTSPRRLLIAAAGPTKGRFPLDLGTPLKTVNVPAITPTTQPDLSSASHTMVKPATFMDRDSPVPHWTRSARPVKFRSGHRAGSRDDPGRLGVAPPGLHCVGSHSYPACPKKGAVLGSFVACGRPRGSAASFTKIRRDLRPIYTASTRTTAGSRSQPLVRSRYTSRWSSTSAPRSFSAEYRGLI